MAVQEFLAKLGEEIVDVDEETFDLFSQTAALPNLGMIDAKAETLELTIAGKDYVVKQSPGLLQSSREQGTTGAAVWQSSVRVAEWLSDPRSDFLSRHGLIDHDSTVLELGSGISGIVANVLAGKVKTAVATDQQHVLKLLQSNLDANIVSQSKGNKSNGRKVSKMLQQPSSDVKVLALDWEEDDVQKCLTSNNLGQGVDVVIACDCIFNYSLIPPLVQACEDICRLRSGAVKETDVSAGTVCLIAQQLRQSEVFEEWLETFMRSFRVWRLPDSMLGEGLKEGSGFVVHVGVLRA